MFTARTLHKAYTICHGQRSSSSRRRRSSSSLKHAVSSGWPNSTAPTPHEILGIERGDPYSKARFNELVKQYHPDLAETKNVPRAVSLERYHLVVAAHKLLSDPYKRGLYESHSHGWAYPSHSSSESNKNVSPWSPGEACQEGRPSPMQWRPIYRSNAAFAMFLIALSMLGAIFQLKRLRKSMRDTKRLETILQEAIQDEIQAWESELHGQSRDDRILAFLARRHGVPQQLQHWAISYGSK
ncbi:hypothetical protein QQS21_002895 [Conoideocrella luteorostrata]|uniref:J domain-containing protein n=1 Tax=Conoideocrella luteorostrata TaxID=1105319 RepID=A0AAJ0CU88_9HYPO|nr:hypothetical protein QQS21_002895 [Conoideocrella luteorostrata]